MLTVRTEVMMLFDDCVSIKLIDQSFDQSFDHIFICVDHIDQVADQSVDQNLYHVFLFVDCVDQFY